MGGRGARRAACNATCSQCDWQRSARMWKWKLQLGGGRCAERGLACGRGGSSYTLSRLVLVPAAVARFPESTSEFAAATGLVSSRLTLRSRHHVHPKTQPHRLRPPEVRSGSGTTGEGSLGEAVRYTTPADSNALKGVRSQGTNTVTAKHGDTQVPSRASNGLEDSSPASALRASRSRDTWCMR